jgi:epsilon-lactone hydrolase
VQSIRSRLVRSFIVKKSMKNLFDPFLNTIEQMREGFAKLNKKITIPNDAQIDQIEIDGIKAEWLKAVNVTGESQKVILYFHSGAFCLGYSNSHRDFAIRISRISGYKVLAVDYRLAPEYQYPAANEDCITAYRWLLKNRFDASNIVMGGDSAGAGLVLMTLLALRDAGEPLPAAAFLLSLFGGDLQSFKGDSYKTRKESDALNSKEGLMKFAEIYLGHSTMVPPINQNLVGLPDLLVQVGGDEIILSDSIRLAERAKESGVKVELEIWDGMWHVFQGFAMIVPEAKKAIINIGEFIKKHLD